ncbi:MAG: hypothetical protein Q8N26_35105 [Myxococcales bacterium]|nr:hypothetical protein [Myxococcales bacterium]
MMQKHPIWLVLSTIVLVVWLVGAVPALVGGPLTSRERSIAASSFWRRVHFLFGCFTLLASFLGAFLAFRPEVLKVRAFVCGVDVVRAVDVAPNDYVDLNLLADAYLKHARRTDVGAESALEEFLRSVKLSDFVVMGHRLQCPASVYSAQDVEVARYSLFVALSNMFRMHGAWVVVSYEAGERRAMYQSSIDYARESSLVDDVEFVLIDVGKASFLVSEPRSVFVRGLIRCDQDGKTLHLWSVLECATSGASDSIDLQLSRPGGDDKQDYDKQSLKVRCSRGGTQLLRSDVPVPSVVQSVHVTGYECLNPRGCSRLCSTNEPRTRVVVEEKLSFLGLLSERQLPHDYFRGLGMELPRFVTSGPGELGLWSVCPGGLVMGTSKPRLNCKPSMKGIFRLKEGSRRDVTSLMWSSPRGIALELREEFQRHEVSGQSAWVGVSESGIEAPIVDWFEVPGGARFAQFPAELFLRLNERLEPQFADAMAHLMASSVRYVLQNDGFTDPIASVGSVRRIGDAELYARVLRSREVDARLPGLMLLIGGLLFSWLWAVRLRGRGNAPR